MGIRIKCQLSIALFLWPFALLSQTQNPAPYRLYGGATYFTNSFNGVPGASGSLLGWQSAAEFPAWHNLRFKIDVSGTTGKNGGASQSSYFVLAGAQYEHAIGRERLFAHALVGDMAITRYWGPKSAPGMTASFAVLLGGGIDTAMSPHFAFRVEGDMQHTNLDVVDPTLFARPERLAGLPHIVGRISTGVIWTPRLGSQDVQESNSGRETPETDVVVEEENSFGHYHIFAGTWWSYFHVAGVEYDRHSWGTFLKARRDYVAEILPVVILEQPDPTDQWGDPYTTAHKTVPGLGISPLGMRLIWRDGTRFKPYYIVKGGMVGFTQKSLSQYASYENFSLQQGTGIQLRLSDKWDLRAGVSDFHFSNGFLVPNNPGIDEMMFGAALSYRLHAGSAPAQ
jgi:hypothetical protein